jgi:hypothetical protein
VSAVELILPDVGKQQGPSFGLRYDWSDFAALKIQYERNFRRARQNYSVLGAQMSFTF